MNRSTFFTLVGAALLLLALPPRPAEAGNTPPETSQLTIPWDEFKRLLDLDEDQIFLSLDVFHKLLAQTGQTTPPPHAVQDGHVVLSRSAFEQLVSQMRPPSGTGLTPPFDHLVTKAVYSGVMREDNTLFTGTFHVTVLADGVYLKVPILPQSTALEDVTVDGKPALVVRENGYHEVVLSKPGPHVVTATFSVRSAVDQGPHKLDLAIVATPITLLQLDLPLRGIAVEIPQAQRVATTSKGDHTLVSAVLASGSGISILWRDAESVAQVLPPKLYSEARHLVSIEDDVLRISSDFDYNILHSEVDRVRLAIPDGLNVLSVEGDGVGEWQEITEDGKRVIVVPFSYARKGAVSLRVVAEQPLSEESNTTTFTGIQALDSVRETGFLGIEVRTSAEVTVTESEGLEPIGVPKLPQVLQAKAVKPLLHGYKYVKHPYRLTLSIRKHEKVAVPVAAISSANAVTLFTADGKVVYRVIYQVKNSAKQFLEVEVPDDASIWSVFVDNQPVESAWNAEGKLLVPLIRSRVENQQLSDFPVEIVYCLVGERFSPLARREAMLPAVDLLVSQVLWSVYLPQDYHYIRFASTLEKERIIQNLNLFTRAPRQYDEGAMKDIHARGGVAGDLSSDDRLRDAYKGKSYASEFPNVTLNEEQMKRQVTAEIEFGQRLERLEPAHVASPPGGLGAGGVLPIQITIPTGGQIYRFARTLVRSDDPLTMSVSYASGFLMGLFKWIAVALALWILYLMRGFVLRPARRLWGWLREFAAFCTHHAGAANRAARSMMTLAVLLALLGPAWLVSPVLASLVLGLLWLSAVYQALLWSRRRMEARTQERGQATSGAPAVEDGGTA